MTMRRWLIAGAVIVAMSACGKSEAQKQAEQAAEDARKAAEAVAKAAESATGAAGGAADLGKALGGMAAALSGAAGGDGKIVEPVTFQALQTMLPRVSGWEMSEPEGERMTSPVPFSQTEAKYKKGDAEVEVKIVDTGFSQLLVAPWSMMMAMGYAKESSSGYEKATTILNSPGFEKWQKNSKNGELNIFVGKRFLLTIEGNDIADTKVLHEFAGQMDFGKLASLK
jgi:hypothetical protein